MFQPWNSGWIHCSFSPVCYRKPVWISYHQIVLVLAPPDAPIPLGDSQVPHHADLSISTSSNDTVSQREIARKGFQSYSYLIDFNSHYLSHIIYAHITTWFVPHHFSPFIYYRPLFRVTSLSKYRLTMLELLKSLPDSWNVRFAIYTLSVYLCGTFFCLVN